MAAQAQMKAKAACDDYMLKRKEISDNQSAGVKVAHESLVDLEKAFYKAYKALAEVQKFIAFDQKSSPEDCTTSLKLLQQSVQKDFDSSLDLGEKGIWSAMQSAKARNLINSMATFALPPAILEVDGGDASFTEYRKVTMRGSGDSAGREMELIGTDRRKGQSSVIVTHTLKGTAVLCLYDAVHPQLQGSGKTHAGTWADGDEAKKIRLKFSDPNEAKAVQSLLVTALAAHTHKSVFDEAQLDPAQITYGTASGDNDPTIKSQIKCLIPDDVEHDLLQQDAGSKKGLVTCGVLPILEKRVNGTSTCVKVLVPSKWLNANCDGPECEKIMSGVVARSVGPKAQHTTVQQIISDQVPTKSGNNSCNVKFGPTTSLCFAVSGFTFKGSNITGTTGLTLVAVVGSRADNITSTNENMGVGSSAYKLPKNSADTDCSGHDMTSFTVDFNKSPA